MAARRKQTSTTIPIGSCFAVALRDGRFAACQVIAAGERDQVEVIALDWLGDHQPSLAELADARTLILTHHGWDGEPERCMVPSRPPPQFIALGVLPPLASFAEPCRSYGFWQGVVTQVASQHFWDHEAPKAEVAAYEQAKQRAREKVEIELGGECCELSRGTSRVSIASGGAFAVEPDAKLDWAALDELGQLGSIEYEGHDAGVVDYVTRRVLLGELRWRGHGQRVIDLSRARLRRFAVEVGEGPLLLKLSAEIETLQLEGGRAQALRVEHPEQGRGLQLSIYDLRDAVPPPIAGLERLSELNLAKPRAVDLAALGYAGLESLSIHFDAGRVLGLGSLASRDELRELSFYDVYDMDPDELPTPSEAPQLVAVQIRGLRKTHAAIIKKRLAGLAQLELSGAKTDAWLAANAHNPFNNWVDESAALGRAACKAYKQTVARVAKLDPADPEALHAELLAFVQAFNRIDAKQGLDTIHREHIGEVFHQIAADSAFDIDEDTLAEWFDEDREF